MVKKILHQKLVMFKNRVLFLNFFGLKTLIVLPP